jgi:hypothetical protein
LGYLFLVSWNQEGRSRYFLTLINIKDSHLFGLKFFNIFYSFLFPKILFLSKFNKKV